MLGFKAEHFLLLFLRTYCAAEEYQVRKGGADDRWSSFLHLGKNLKKKPDLCLEEILFDVVCHCQGSADSQNLLSEQRMRYNVEAKISPAGNPLILSANVTRGLGGKTSFAATVKNVFRETASLSGI